jgi:hypothetical protein
MNIPTTFAILCSPAIQVWLYGFWPISNTLPFFKTGQIDIITMKIYENGNKNHLLNYLFHIFSNLKIKPSPKSP